MMTKLGILLDETGGSIKTGPFGTALKAAEYSENGVPLISVGEIGDGRLSIGKKTPRVSEETTERLSEYLLWRGDVVIGRKGAVERSALINEDQDGYFLGSDGMRVRFGDSINSTFMAYQFRSDAVRRWLISHASGTTMASMNQAILSKLPILVPPNRTQQAIAEVLGALDDKIAANERLSSGAQSLLQEHFAMLGLDRFADTGPFLTVNDLFEVNPRTSRKVTGQSPYLGMKDLPDTSMTVSSWSTREAKSGARFVNGDVLLARITPCLENGKAGYVDFLENAEIGIGSTEFIVVRARDPLLSVVPFFLTKSERFRDFAIRHMQGTSGRQRLAASDVAGYQLAEVEDERLNRFGELSTSLLERVRTAVAESQGLAHTRDELLPLLMSGKISVKDAEKVVSDAV
ncbi:restriction endonuclease subunit S [Brevibacterium aurantiacum]|uniref:restriction endonuclease subunit S n=1 Tax=Brevibacterium aurantiacum TaxID=273384 RepID=UPI0001BC2D10|nr:restriction endonuclease subunit S [Brevibacterium aurantiacum]